MICNKCGKENVDTAKFCMWCGESLQTIQEINSNNTIAEEKTNNVEVLYNKTIKPKGLIISFVTILIFIVCISGFLLGKYSVDKKDTSNNDVLEEENLSKDGYLYIPKCVDNIAKKTTLTTDIDETKYNSFVDYIEEQQNVKILIEYCKVDETDPNADSSTGFVFSTYDLMSSEKEIVFNEIRNSIFKISKNGLGGACVSGLKIIYERNNKEYYVKYYQLLAMTSNDGNIYKILDKSVNNTLEQPEYCFYGFNNLSSTVSSTLKQLRGY